jgi:hypothetical protein
MYKSIENYKKALQARDAIKKENYNEAKHHSAVTYSVKVCKGCNTGERENLFCSYSVPDGRGKCVIENGYVVAYHNNNHESCFNYYHTYHTSSPAYTSYEFTTSSSKKYEQDKGKAQAKVDEYLKEINDYIKKEEEKLESLTTEKEGLDKEISKINLESKNQEKEDLKKQIDELKKIQASLRNEEKILNVSTQELLDVFTQITEEIKKQKEKEAEINKIEAQLKELGFNELVQTDEVLCLGQEVNKVEQETKLIDN